MSTTIHLHFSEWLIITIWPIRPRAHNPIENHVESWRLYDGLTWVDPEKAIRPCTNTALLQKIEGKKGKSIGAFLMNCDLFALSRKTQRKIFLIVEYFLLFARVRPCIASYYGWTKTFEIFNAKWSYDKMLIDWLWSGWTGKYLALDHDARTSLRSVRMSWPPTKYFFRALRLDNFHYFLFPVWEFLFSRTKKKHQVFYFTHSSSGSSPTTALVTMVTNVMTTSQIFFSVRP